MKVEFNKWADFYCGKGTTRAQQREILKDALLTPDCSREIADEELDNLFDTIIDLEQEYFEPNYDYDVTINNKWVCSSIEKYDVSN